MRDGDDTDTTEVEAVSIETGIEGGIASAMGAGVKTDGFLKQFELIIRQVFQQGSPQTFYHLGCARAMLLVVAVIFTATIMEIGKEPDDGDIAFGCSQQQAVALDALPM